jgi:hypothetical protein
VLVALDLRAARGYEPLLDAIRHCNAHREEPRVPDAALSVLPAGWRDRTLDDDGTPVRTRYELALWIKARDALRARGLYCATSHRYGDPADWMMPRVQWQRDRPSSPPCSTARSTAHNASRSSKAPNASSPEPSGGL